MKPRLLIAFAASCLTLRDDVILARHPAKRRGYDILPYNTGTK